MAAIGLAIWAGSRGDIPLDPTALRVQIQAAGWWAPLFFVAVAALRPFLLLPSWVVMTAGGLLFGVAGGVVWGATGTGLGGLLAFGIARGLGRDVIESRLRGSVARIDAYLRARGARWMALYTALPVTPLTPVYATAGLSGMSAASFAAAVFVGLLPRTAVYSFFGDSFTQGDWRRTALAALLLVIALALGLVAVARLRRRASADRDRIGGA